MSRQVKSRATCKLRGNGVADGQPMTFQTRPRDPDLEILMNVLEQQHLTRVFKSQFVLVDIPHFEQLQFSNGCESKYRSFGRALAGSERIRAGGVHVVDIGEPLFFSGSNHRHVIC